MKRHHIAASVLTALVVFTAVGFLVFGGTNDKSGAASRDKHGHATTTSTTTVEEGTINDTEVQAYVREQVTIKTVSFKCTELVAMLRGPEQVTSTGVVKWDIGALLPVANATTPGRTWSDAMSTPFVATTAEAGLTEIQSAMCQDPLLGVSFAHLLAHLEVSGVKVVDLNPWLKPFVVDAEQINVLAAKYVHADVNDNSTKAQKKEAYKWAVRYMHLAEKLGTMLTRFQVGIDPAPQSVINYHLVAGGAVVGTLPPVELNPVQENLAALTFKLTQKTGECLKAIGFNMQDKRPEVFVECVVAPPATTTVPPSTPPGSSPPGTPGTNPPGSTSPPPVVTTVPPTAPPTVPTTTPTTEGRKANVATTVAPPQATPAPPPVATTAPGGSHSGDGATSTVPPSAVPTTAAPPAPPPTPAPEPPVSDTVPTH